MTEYILASRHGDKVLYGVLSADSDTAAGLAVLDAADDEGSTKPVFFRLAYGEAVANGIEIQCSDRIIGAGWFELAPTEPISGGQPGGERQDGKALVRRFALKRSDGKWAVVIRHVYRAIPLEEPLDSDERVIEESFEFLICKDLHDVHGSEFFGYETFTGLPYQPTWQMVRRRSFVMFPSAILWDGQEFEDGSHGVLVKS